MLRLYRQMSALLSKRGLPAREPYQPPYEYSAIISPRIIAGQETIAWLTEAASRAAYDANPFDMTIIPEARKRLAHLQRVIGRRH